MTSALLLPLAFLSLFAIGLGAFLLNQMRERRLKMGKRFNKALDPFARKRNTDPDTGTTARLAMATPSQTLGERARRIFGFNQARLDMYPASPQILIGAAFLVAGALSWLLGLIVGLPGILAVPVLWVMLSRMIFGRSHKRRAQILFQQFPDALAMIVRAARVGIPLAESIRAVSRENEAPTADEFARLSSQLAIGLPLEEALRAMSQRNGLPEYRFFATALSLQSQTGGNLGETLEGLADVIRKRVAARSRGYALAAEARMSANVLTALPVVLFFVLEFVNPTYASTLLNSHVGHMILGATLVLLIGGTLVMRMLIQKSLS